jgi:hypothetical protein
MDESSQAFENVYSILVQELVDISLVWVSAMLRAVGHLPEDDPGRVEVEAKAEAFLTKVRLSQMVLLDDGLGELDDLTAGPTNE